MRPILLQDLQQKIPTNWIAAAADADAAAASATADERAKVINAHSAVWSALKETLLGLSHGKCWYCESIDIRSDNAVDHFRPKNHVKECPDKDNEGYWWLAFKWENYRFSCTFCNSARRSATTAGGKQDRFPLVDETKRARKKDDPLFNENPILLDPTEPADCVLMTFDEDGTAVSVYGKNEDPDAYERVTQSIEIYHLNHPKLVERRAVLIQRVLYALTLADELMKAKNTVAYKEKVKEITPALDQKAEYSIAAKTGILARRATSATAEKLARL
jgi:uncharacterized protein (TIGR02646 family)